jgi:predicted PurR-regulated permease PerM
VNLNRENCLKIFLIAAGIVVLFWAVNHFDQLAWLLSTLLGWLSPFIVGGCIAFVLNVPMRALEHLLFRPSKKTGIVPSPKWKRPLCMLLSIILVTAALILVVAPQLGNVVMTIKDATPGFISTVQQWSADMMQKYPELSQLFQKIDQQNINWQGILDGIWQFLREGAGSMFQSTVGVIGSVFSGATTVFLGFFFACYLLAQKETLARQFKKLFYANFKSEHVDESLRILRLTNKTFSSFITGQCLEAVILGAMFWITMSIFRMPYAGTISVLIAFTALIPVFGAFIGMILGILLILVVNPIQALWFAILFLVLQQIEGNLIYPRVVGSSVGLPGIWVLVAVTIGGSAFGVVGMLVMVPLASVIYALVREKTAKQISVKKIPTSKYQDSAR